MQTSANTNLLDRMRRAAALDPSLYDEVEADPGATVQALIVVIIVAIAGGIGLTVFGGHAGGVLSGVVGALVGWIVWSFVTFWVGTRIFDGTSTPGKMLRTIGFAQTPRIFDLLAFIPILGGLIRLVVYFWLLVAGIIAIRQALEFGTGRAIGTALIGWVVMVVIDVVLAILTHSVAGLGAAFH